MTDLSLFWTEPPPDDGVRPTDPLGLDAMREELADRLVPCLTGRTKRHEDFYWTLAFIKWAAKEPTDQARMRSFLRYERWLKLLWSHSGRDGFAGVRGAQRQAIVAGAPCVAYEPLLKNARFQGMLGSHLVPLRIPNLGFIVKDALVLTDDGAEITEGVGSAIEHLRDGDWRQWKRAFTSAESGFNGAFVRRLRQRLRDRMPWLPLALSNCGWRMEQDWTRAARSMDASLAPYANLAGEFVTWASDVRAFFQDAVLTNGHPSRRLPASLRSPIPPDLVRWAPLRHALGRWSSLNRYALLAKWHKEVFESRGYGRTDLWLMFEDSKPKCYPGRASLAVESDGSDCRWGNAVALMRPLRGE